MPFPTEPPPRPGDGLGFDIPTASDLAHLSLHSPILSRVIAMYTAGQCSWEDALAIAVVNLYRENKALKDQLYEVVSLLPPRPIIVRENPNGDT